MTTMEVKPRQLLTRRLFVAWQNPETRSIEPVAMLTQAKQQHSEPNYAFSYLRRARGLSGFEPFGAFPEIGKVYYSDELFPFFANRLLARKRPDYQDLMDLLDLSVEAEPFEVLARSGARRETDRIEVFPEPTVTEDGQGTCLFFVRGLRYVTGSEQLAETLKSGDALRILCDVQNPVNRAAILLARITDSDFRPLGYMPDYLADHAQTMISECGPMNVRIRVEHVNPASAPRHMRVLCRITSCWPPGYQPFPDDGYEPIADADSESDIASAATARWVH